MPTPATSMNPLLQMTGITKRFGQTLALDHVDFDVRAGEVHALVGENGAGKSTMMNVLAGRFDDYEGDVVFDSKLVRLRNPRQAQAMGIHVVFQELSVLPNLTVVENILLGQEPGSAGWRLDRSAMRDRARQTLERLGFDLPLDARLDELSAARQCLVEIARAMHRQVSLIVFDEPTAALGEEEVRKLFKVIHELKAKGLGMVYISHRLAELSQIADRVTVLRDGKVVGTRPISDCRPIDLTKMMLGREISEMFPQHQPPKPEVLLKVRHLARAGVFEDVNFDLHAGEILGLAGLIGSGRTEIARAIVGADDATGEVELQNDPLSARRPDKCLERGLVMVPENRKRDGILTSRPVRENINAGFLKQLTGPGGFLSPHRSKSQAQKMIDQMQVQPPRQQTEIQKLSGGNQQKVIIGRVLAPSPRVLIFDEPTQGIDVGTKAQIYKLIVDLAARGCGVILISSEFIELVELAHRVLIIRDGSITDELTSDGLSEETLFSACAGVA